MRVREIVGLGLVCGVASAGVCVANDDWTTTAASFICRSSTEVRAIKTYVKDPANCRVDYIKDGSTRTIWSSNSSRSYCNGRAATLAAKLAAGRFTCEPLHPLPPDSDGDATPGF